MRRKDREVKDFDRIIEIINACDCCRLGLVDEGEAYIVPMNFGFDTADGKLNLYFHCASEGRKLDLLGRNQTVSFEMDTAHALTTGARGCDWSFKYQCVMGTGTVTELADRDERIYALNRIMAHYSDCDNWKFDDRYLSVVTILKLSVETLSCKEH